MNYEIPEGFGFTDLDPGKFDFTDTEEEDSGSVGEDVLFSGKGQDSEECISEPHLSFPLSEFSKFLNLAKFFSWNHGRDLVSRSVFLEVEGGEVVCRATDLESFLEYRIPLTDTDNLLEEGLVLHADLLSKILRASYKTVAIRKVSTGLQFRVIGGWVPLESVILDGSVYIKHGACVKQGEMDSFLYRDVLNSFVPFTNSAIAPQDRTIRFHSDAAYVSFMWASASYKGSFVPHVLRVREAGFLRSLLSDISDPVTVSRISGEVPYIVFECPVFKFSTLEVSSDVSDRILTQPSSYLVTDMSHLVRLVSLSVEMPSSLGMLGLSYDGEFRINLYNRLEKNTSILLPSFWEGSVDGGRFAEVTLQSRLFKVLLSVFPKTGYIDIAVAQDSILLIKDGVTARCEFEEFSGN